MSITSHLTTFDAYSVLGFTEYDKDNQKIVIPTTTPIVADANRTSIVPRSFLYGCLSAKEVLLPTDVTEIGDYAFARCGSLVVLSFKNNPYKAEVGMCRIPEYINKIGREAFSECSGFTKIIVPSTVDEIDFGAFSSITALQSITLPLTIDTVSTYSIRFENSTANTVIVPNGKTNLDKLAFANNSTIKSVVLPDSITTIEESAFAKCVSLESVVMNNVSVIKTSAFEYCESLTTLTLPTTLTKVEGYAFYGCEKLNNISYLGTALQWANVEINQTGNQVLNNTVFA